MAGNTLMDALRQAGKDPKFAADLMSNPEKFRQQYNINDGQVADIKSLWKASQQVIGDAKATNPGDY
jgi:hypothetical protein